MKKLFMIVAFTTTLLSQGIEQYLPPEVEGRMHIKEDEAKTLFNQGESFVWLQSGAFYLDPNYIPRAKKNERFYLITHGAMTNDQKKQLREIGVDIQTLLSQMAWVVTVKNNSTINKLQKLDFFYAIGKVDPRDKFSPRILKKGFVGSQNSDGSITVTVSVMQDKKSKRRVKKAIYDLGGSIDQDYNSMLITLPSVEDVAELALVNETIWFEDKPTPLSTGY